MGVSTGKRKADTIDLTGDSDDNLNASPQTPNPPKKARAEVPTPTSSGNRHPRQAGGSGVYQSSQPSRQSSHNVPSSSAVPSLTQSPSSSLFFNDDEEVVDGEDDDYENLCLYGTIAGELSLR